MHKERSKTLLTRVTLTERCIAHHEQRLVSVPVASPNVLSKNARAESYWTVTELHHVQLLDVSPLAKNPLAVHRGNI